MDEMSFSNIEIFATFWFSSFSEGVEWLLAMVHNYDEVQCVG